MSDLAPGPAPVVRGGHPDRGPVRDLLLPRETALGGSTVVRRLLPSMGRRMVGAWCFVDHYGPDDIADEP
ncbi:pirin family protein, partial [Kitasatospora sp. NPDC054939]